MLDDMPKSQSVALTADPEDAIATRIRPPAKRRGRRVSLGGGPHALRVAGSSVGSFAAGNYFRVVVETPSHELVLGPVVAY